MTTIYTLAVRQAIADLSLPAAMLFEQAKWREKSKDIEGCLVLLEEGRLGPSTMLPLTYILRRHLKDPPGLARFAQPIPPIGCSGEDANLYATVWQILFNTVGQHFDGLLVVLAHLSQERGYDAAQSLWLLTEARREDMSALGFIHACDLYMGMRGMKQFAEGTLDIEP